MTRTVDAVVVGGGPSGATAASALARAGHETILLDRAGRIKPCGGAVPPRLLRDYAIPDHLVVGRATAARMIAPSDKAVDMPVGNTFVGMVDRGEYDEWLRARAARDGAERIAGTFEGLTRDADGTAVIHYRPKGALRGNGTEAIRTRAVIGADGARSGVAKAAGIRGADRVPCVFAYHEVVESPSQDSEAFARARCDVFYQGKLSPDFYAWVFPHGDQASIGVGSANKGFALREAVAELRRSTGLDAQTTIRCEGAPIPLKPLKKWDNGRDLVVAGDAAGVVAPASGEGIYYAMTSGLYAAQGVADYLASGRASALTEPRRRFMKEHGRVFWILGIMQYFWYGSDRRREKFVKICEDPDVQALTWQAYCEKKLVRAKPAAHVRIFFKDLAHLMGSAG
jgi:geranylgeranyl reductase